MMQVEAESQIMQNTRILIVEDDATLNNQVATLLRNRGFIIDQCHDGQHGLARALREQFDLILLDVLLPSLNGFSFLNLLRQNRQTPVMMITACGAEEERIMGYQRGADDYLPKPFNFTEMLLKVDALLRRMKPAAPVLKNTTISIGELWLERTSQRVVYAGEEIEFTPIQFRLLWMLAENRGEVMSKPCLCQMVLERSFSTYDRSLDMHVSRVRKKLVEAGMSPDRLATVHGKGYCFS